MKQQTKLAADLAHYRALNKKGFQVILDGDRIISFVRKCYVIATFEMGEKTNELWIVGPKGYTILNPQTKAKRDCATCDKMKATIFGGQCDYPKCKQKGAKR